VRPQKRAVKINLRETAKKFGSIAPIAIHAHRWEHQTQTMTSNARQPGNRISNGH
jgi:hypothetical protein